MQRHIFQPIPNLDSLPEPENKEERLQIIIANLDAHHLAVRSSILAEAQQKKLELLRDNNNNNNNVATGSEMDIDPPQPQQANDYAALILANLNAPYIEGSADPAGSVLKPDPNVVQLPLSPIVLLTQETTRMLEAYDRQAGETKGYYVKALERMRARNGGEGRRDPRRKPRVETHSHSSPSTEFDNIQSPSKPDLSHEAVALKFDEAMKVIQALTAVAIGVPGFSYLTFQNNKWLARPDARRDVVLVAGFNARRGETPETVNGSVQSAMNKFDKVI